MIREAGGDRSRGDRRHARAVGPHRRRDHAGAGQELPGPHDRARRGRRAAQDAERDRARHPARRADADLPRRRRRAAAVRAVLGHAGLGDDADRAARRADPDDDRRAAERDRHRRHGPARAPQRARALRPRGRGVRRRRRAAARQDRHDHARQPPGVGVHRRCPASSEAELAEAAQMRLAGRRDARGPLDRRARQGALRPARARPRRARRALRARSPRRRA